jgi:hypothetical protein
MLKCQEHGRESQQVTYKVSGAWKALFNSGVNFISTAAGFGDANGKFKFRHRRIRWRLFHSRYNDHDGRRFQKPVEQVDIRDEVAVADCIRDR